MRSLAILLVLICAACGGTTAMRTQYLLRSDPVERAGPVEAPVRVGIGRVQVAPYLDQSGIVVETASRQVNPAREHQWAEPLAAGVRSYLRAELSKALGYDVSPTAAERLRLDYTIDVYIDRLHGTMSGSAVLDASYRITPRAGAGDMLEYRFSQSAPLPRAGYPGVVDAEAGLVRDLAGAIAEAVRAAPAP